MRKIATLFVALGLVAGLTACSAPAEEAPPAEQESTNSSECLAASGPSSDAVTVEGEFNTASTAEFDFPIEVTETERTVLQEGDGDVVESGNIVSTGLAMYNGTTGEELSNNIGDGRPASLPVSMEQVLPGLVHAFQCSTVGSRIVAVMPPSDLWGDQGYPDLGVGGTDSVVLVADIIDIVPPPAPPELPKPLEWTENVPEVELGDAPVVTLPEGDAPAELLLAVLEEGDGPVVEPGASVTVDYQGTSWETREIFDESYGKAPATFNVNGVVQGFGAALVGQKVGSTVLVTMPPELAYGTDPAAHDLGGQSLLFLIEIRGIA